MYKVGKEEVKLKKMSSSKAFEDRALIILTEMREKRKSLQTENTFIMTEVNHSGWRVKIKDKDDLNKDNNGKEDVKYDNGGIHIIKDIALKIKRKFSIGKAEDLTNCVTEKRDKKEEETSY